MLRQYQIDGLNSIKKEWNNHVNTQLLVWATGLGKTVLFSNLKSHLSLPGKVLVIVHREELARQALDKIKTYNPGLTASLEMAQSTALNTDYVVASVQSISRDNRLNRFNPKEFSAVVVDEAHHATANSYKKVIRYFQHGNMSSLCLGVTATPNRADGKGLGDLFSKIVHEYSLFKGIKDGWLVDLIGQQIRTSTNLDDAKILGGDFNLSDLDKLANTPIRNAEVIEGWKQHGQNRKTIGFAIDIAHAKALAEMAKMHGIPATYISANTPDSERNLKLKFHKEGKIKIIFNCGILTEGYDDWEVDCILLGRPTKSEGLYAQMIGRGSRIDPRVGNMLAPLCEPAKKDCLILDCTDNSDRHSLVTLANLAGINNAKVAINGKKFSSVVEKVAKVKEQFPGFDFTEADCEIDKLETYAKQVDLFQVKFTPEVLQWSSYKWYRTDKDTYALLLANKEKVTISPISLLDRFSIAGSVNGTPIEDSAESLQEALKLADNYVKVYAGQMLTLVKQSAKWHNDPPTDKQVKACKWLGIKIPPGATKGEVHSKISEVMAKRSNKQ